MKDQKSDKKTISPKELREKFLKFFQSKAKNKIANHKLKESSDLTTSDPSLLFVNSGMVQFKDFLSDTAKSKDDNVISIQKCLRVGGKHNDLNEIGKSPLHHTFFEMLGNFAFGNENSIGREEAIKLVWSFLTEELKLPKDKLHITCHAQDEKTQNVWSKIMGIDFDPSSDENCELDYNNFLQKKNKLFREKNMHLINSEENWWSVGNTDGDPCGFCTEIYYDIAGDKGESISITDVPNNKYIEIWNLVFPEYTVDNNRQERIIIKIQDIQNDVESSEILCSDIITHTINALKDDSKNDPEDIIELLEKINTNYSLKKIFDSSFDFEKFKTSFRSIITKEKECDYFKDLKNQIYKKIIQLCIFCKLMKFVIEGIDLPLSDYLQNKERKILKYCSIESFLSSIKKKHNKTSVIKDKLLNFIRNLLLQYFFNVNQSLISTYLRNCHSSQWSFPLYNVWNYSLHHFPEYIVNRKKTISTDSVQKEKVDTGAGFERLCVILENQNKNTECDYSTYETSIFKPIIKEIDRIYNIKPEAVSRFLTSRRIIADHLRAICFLIAEGIMPSNKQAGYVLRKIMRRAIYNAYKIDDSECKLNKIVPIVISTVEDSYPELKRKEQLISDIISEEENAFMAILNRTAPKLKKEIKNPDRLDNCCDDFENRIKSFVEKAYPNEKEKQKIFQGVEVSIEERKKQAMLSQCFFCTQQYKRLSNNPTLYATQYFIKTLPIEEYLVAQMYDVEGLPTDIGLEIVYNGNVSDESKDSVEICLAEIQGKQFHDLIEKNKTSSAKQNLQQAQIDELKNSISKENKTTNQNSQQTQVKKPKITDSTNEEDKTIDESNDSIAEKNGLDDVKILNLKKADLLKEGAEILLVFNNTIFHPSGGGQLGDVGFVYEKKQGSIHKPERSIKEKYIDSFEYKDPWERPATDRLFEITDTIKDCDTIIHRAKVLKTHAYNDDSTYFLELDAVKRYGSSLHHSATHLLHWALRKHFGSGVTQQGSQVYPDRLRFDFTHSGKITDKDIYIIESMLNGIIQKNLKIDIKENYDKNKACSKYNAIALFGEKYQDLVRVVFIGKDEEKIDPELCGGTHVERTGNLGSFEIINYKSIGTGSKRIEGVVGRTAYRYTRKIRSTLKSIEPEINFTSSSDEFLKEPDSIQDELKIIKDNPVLNDKKKSQQENKSSNNDRNLEILSRIKELIATSEPKQGRDNKEKPYVIYPIDISDIKSIHEIKNKIKDIIPNTLCFIVLDIQIRTKQDKYLACIRKYNDTESKGIYLTKVSTEIKEKFNIKEIQEGRLHPPILIHKLD